MADDSGAFAAAAPGGSGGSATAAHSSRDKAFEIFVKRTITSIQKEAWGRSKEVREIREACQAFLNTLEQTGCTEATLREVLYPLQLACASSMQKVVELALGCLHKLVAHAWLHGESTPSGSMDMLSAHGSLGEDDAVAQVIKMVVRAGESAHEGLQLAVVRALLTFTTAEHFVAHGECLLAAVRAVFNLALGAEDSGNKRTAANALLQMLNTICKRVTQIQPRLTGSSECSSRTASEALEMFQRSTSGASFYGASPKSNRGSGTGGSGLGMLPAGGHGSGGALASATAHSQALSAAVEAAAAADDDGGGGTPRGAARSARVSSSSSAARAAQLAELAERKDLQGLEAALEAGSGGGEDDDSDASDDDGPDGRASASAAAAVAAGLQSLRAEAAGGAPAAAANGAAPAAGQPGGAALPPLQPLARQPSTPSHAGGRHGRHGQRLSTPERDVLLVLTAFCKLASREAPAGASSDSVLAQGKLLALEMLAKVLASSYHNWDHVPEPFCRQLRQPLCLALLRNCASPDPAAYGLALRLLTAILTPPPEAGNVSAALSALAGLLGDPQLLVDLYVNFDCDMQASNLYERTVQVLSRLATASEGEGEGGARPDKRGTPEAAAAAAAMRRQALSCCLQVVAALESWARPIKDAALRAADGDGAGSHGGAPGGALHGAGSLSGGSLASLGGAPPGAGGASPGTPTAGQGQQSEAERAAAAKSAKDALARGIALFNTRGPAKGLEALMAAGLVGSRPDEVASFLRAHADALDKAALGELLGGHEDWALALMHAWVEAEPSMAGAPLDAALRQLLGGFRLPGEAQKIDRVMEKFAERYCKDNPSRFASADAAYMLAFAIIMLNTDAHNPLAERRLGRADFVAMAHTAPGGDDGGPPAPVLPVAELEGIYDRVVRQEIVVVGETGNAHFSTSRTNTRNRLAAAMGWTSLLQPFRALAGGGSGGGRAGRDSHAQRRYLQELAEREVSRAAASGNVWCCASHPEHVRPMLQVGFPLLLQALSAALSAAPDAAATAPLLTGVLQLVRLTGLLGLDSQCEAAVGVLAARCGVFDPAPAGSVAEAKQLCVLQGLLSLTAGPEAGFLGSSWVTILRAVSALEALKHELTRPATVPAAPPPRDAGAAAGGGSAFSRMLASMFGSGGGREPPPSPGSGGGAGGLGPLQQQQQQQQQQQLPPELDVVRDSLDGSHRAAPVVRDAPGAGLVLWAESAAGAVELERPYTRSTTLDGDAIIVFMRALCAVSQEELEAGSSSTAAAAAADAGAAAGRGPLASPSPSGLRPGGPRLFSLQKVVEAGHHNMGRIRLVWAKLWAVIAAQLVGASCHPHRRVALYAVDSLRQLVAKQLARAELEHFTHQEDALRPFVAVLRQCDEACVRELAVQCVMQAVTAHADDLGSGWRKVILALRLGAADGSPAVMAQTQEALQVVVDSLYAGSSGHSSGHTFLRETVQAVVAGIRNPAHLELSISAVQLLGRCGARLAALEDAGGREAPPAAAVAAAPGGVDLDGDYGWGLLLRSLADVLQHDRRPAVVDAALGMAFGLLSRYSARWDAPAWRVFIHRLVRHMLALPPGLVCAADAPGAADVRRAFGSAGGLGPGGAVPASLSASEAGALTSTLLQRMDRFYPQLCAQAAAVRPEFQAELVQQLAAIAVAWYQLGSVYISTAGIKALLALADTLSAITAPPGAGAGPAAPGCGWRALLDPVAGAVAADVEAVLSLARRQLADAAAASSDAARQQELAATGRLPGGGGGGGGRRGGALRGGSPAGSPRAAAAAAATGGAFATASPLGGGGAKGGAVARQAAAAAAAQASQLRVRSRQLVLLQRALATMHRECRASMGWDEEMQLLQVLATGVEAAIAFNTELSVGQQQRQQRRLAAAPAPAAAPAASPQPPRAPAPALQQEQGQEQACAQAVRVASLGESISLASAMESPSSSVSSAAGPGALLAGFGSVSSVRLPSSELSPHPSFSGGARGSAGGSAAPSAGGASSAGGAASAASVDSFFHLRSSAGGLSSAGGAGPGLLLSRSTTGSNGSAGLVGSTGGGSGAEAAGAPAATGPVSSLGGSGSGSGSAGGGPDAFGSPCSTAPPGAEEAPASTASATRGQQQQQQQQQQQPGSQPPLPQQQQLPGLAPVRTSQGVGQVRSSSDSPRRQAGAGAGFGSPASVGSSRLSTSADAPQLLVSSPESVEEVLPALMRLEAEGGLLLIEALQRSLGAAGVPALGAAAARQRLLQLVRRVIQSEAACSSAAGPLMAAAAPGWCGSGAAAPGAAAGCSHDNALQDALAGVGWDHAARAPLVVAALQVLAALRGAEYAAEVAALFPALCRLMCSSHLLTRSALARVLGSADFRALVLPGDKAVSSYQQQQQQQRQQPLWQNLELEDRP